jgi:Bacterial SH3 domain
MARDEDMRRILRLGLGLAISMAPIAPALAELAMTGAPVTMRAGPTGRAAVVQRIPQNAEIDLEKCDRNWCRASWRGRSGYIPAEAVALGSPPTALPGDKMPPPAVNAPTDAARPSWRWTGPYLGVNGGFGSSSW